MKIIEQTKDIEKQIMIINKIHQLIKSSARVLVAMFICSLFLLTAVSPAQATPSKTTDGEVSLSQIQSKTDSIAKSDPRGLQEVTKEAQKGLNAVQGGADKDKMIAPEDASDVTTVKEKAANFLQDLTN